MILEEIHRTFAILNKEIGSWGTAPASRRLSRKIIFELIEIENNFDQDSQIAIKSKLMAVNKRISNPNNRIKLNVLDKSKGKKLEFKLTRRELEVLQLFPEGLSIKEMADRLYLTSATIKSHMYSIYQKLEVTNRVLAIAKAKDNNLLDS
jgi:DNA-binding NarL/FixJ family response regulator